MWISLAVAGFGVIRLMTEKPSVDIQAAAGTTNQTLSTTQREQYPTEVSGRSNFMANPIVQEIVAAAKSKGFAVKTVSAGGVSFEKDGALTFCYSEADVQKFKENSSLLLSTP